MNAEQMQNTDLAVEASVVGGCLLGHKVCLWRRAVVSQAAAHNLLDLAAEGRSAHAGRCMSGLRNKVQDDSGHRKNHLAVVQVNAGSEDGHFQLKKSLYSTT